MSSQDAWFLHAENRSVSMHIGNVSVFEGPPPSYDELLEHVVARLPAVPRYRQHVRFAPLDAGRPVWVDDAAFALDYHVRHTALPAPGGSDQLRQLTGRLMSQHLDRQRPLWEMELVEGLEGGRWALVNKVHHCMVDGVSGADLTAVMYDRSGTAPTLAAAVEKWAPEPEPSRLRLALAVVRDLPFPPRVRVEAVHVSAEGPRRAASLGWRAARGAVSLAGLVKPVRASSLNGPIGPNRRYAWARTRLEDVNRIRARFGGTVNDVILACVTNGFRRLLLGRGEPVDGRLLRSLVPVSVRRPAERGSYDNRVSAMFAELPVGLADPVERLHAMRRQLARLKQEQQAVAGEVLVSLSELAPSVLLALGMRAAFRAPGLNRAVSTVTTNVPGPQFPLYLRGRRLLEIYPYVPIAHGVRIGVAILSYLGALNVGVTGDYDTTPDLEVVCLGIEDAVADLLAAAA